MSLSSGIDGGECFAGLDGEAERVLGGFEGLWCVGELGVEPGGDERVGEACTGGVELGHDLAVVWECGEPPFLELSEEEHEAVAGEFEWEEVGSVGGWEEAGLECEDARGAGVVLDDEGDGVSCWRFGEEFAPGSLDGGCEGDEVLADQIGPAREDIRRRGIGRAEDKADHHAPSLGEAIFYCRVRSGDDKPGWLRVLRAVVGWVCRSIGRMSDHETCFRTELSLANRREGKVRDVYDLPAGPGGVGVWGSALPRVLLIATDRLSAFDVVMPTPIPGKGVSLTRISGAWFDRIESAGLVRTHRVACGSGCAGLLREAGVEGESARRLSSRSTVGVKCAIVPIECVARGYLDGSGWREYRERGRVCGVSLPVGLERGSRLPEPIFTPATKAEFGAHDENISFEEACDRVGGEVMGVLRDRTLRMYVFAHEIALERGLILADTKFEFGYVLDGDGARLDGDPVLADEALTPDSSRYWPVDGWKPGGEQPSFDKQFVRDYLQGLVESGRWDKRAPGPMLPEEVVSGTLSRYAEADRLLTSSGL